MYLSSIQVGIQSAHAQMSLFVKYDKIVERDMAYGDHPALDHQLYSSCVDTLYDWASTHQTMICLNGGYLSNMQDIKSHLSHHDNPFPWSYFNESPEAMGGLLTNIAIVLPARIYETAAWLRGRGNNLKSDMGSYVYPFDVDTPHSNDAFTQWELDLMRTMNRCSLST